MHVYEIEFTLINLNRPYLGLWCDIWKILDELSSKPKLISVLMVSDISHRLGIIHMLPFLMNPKHFYSEMEPRIVLDARFKTRGYVIFKYEMHVENSTCRFFNFYAPFV